MKLIFIAGATALALSGCGGGEEPSSASEAGNDTSTKPDEVVAFGETAEQPETFEPQKREYDVNISIFDKPQVVKARDSAEENAPVVETVEIDGVFVLGNDDDSISLSCDLGFDQLRQNVLGVDGMELMQETGSQEAFMRGPTSFTLTKEGHPAHPLIVRREIVNPEDQDIDIKMSACGFADRESTEQMLSQFEALNRQYKLQSKFSMSEGEPR